MEITARQAVGVLITILLPYIVLGITVLLMMDGRYIAWIDRHIEKPLRSKKKTLKCKLKCNTNKGLQ